MNTNSKSEHHPFDKSFRYMSGEYPLYLHANLNLPGKFIKSCENDVVNHKKVNLRMDLLILVGPDGKAITENTLINLEHQTSKLDEDKIEIIAEYKDFSKCRHHCPILSMVITSDKSEKQIKEYGTTSSDITRPVFIYMDNEEIKKRLNNLETKIRNKEILEKHEILDFGIIAIFAKEKSIIEKLCKLYENSKYVKGKIRNDMALILDSMIKTRFKGETKKIEELSNMIEEEREAAKRGMRIWYEEEFAKIDAEHTKEIKIKDVEHAKELARKNTEIYEKENEIKELEDQRQHYKEKIDELKEKGKIVLEIFYISITKLVFIFLNGIYQMVHSVHEACRVFLLLVLLAHAEYELVDKVIHFLDEGFENFHP